jgi:hypothetical protein
VLYKSVKAYRASFFIDLMVKFDEKGGIKLKQYSIAIAIFSLAISFVIGSWLIATSLREQPKEPVQHQLLSQEEAADYLGIHIGEVLKLTEIPDGSNSYISEIPHVKVGKKVYYPKQAMDRWLLDMELIVVP